MYDYSYYYDYSYPATSSADVATIASAIAVIALPIILFSIAIAILQIIGMWKMFSKAGEAGWKSIIPIYNMVILLKISGMSPWLVLLYFVPIANLVVMILQPINLSKAFGKSGGFAVGLIFLAPIFYMILGFGKAEYVGVQNA